MAPLALTAASWGHAKRELPCRASGSDPPAGRSSPAVAAPGDRARALRAAGGPSMGPAGARQRALPDAGPQRLRPLRGAARPPRADPRPDRQGGGRQPDLLVGAGRSQPVGRHAGRRPRPAGRAARGAALADRPAAAHLHQLPVRHPDGRERAAQGAVRARGARRPLPGGEHRARGGAQLPVRDRGGAGARLPRAGHRRQAEGARLSGRAPRRRRRPGRGRAGRRPGAARPRRAGAPGGRRAGPGGAGAQRHPAGAGREPAAQHRHRPAAPARRRPGRADHPAAPCRRPTHPQAVPGAERRGGGAGPARRLGAGDVVLPELRPVGLGRRRQRRELPPPDRPVRAPAAAQPGDLGPVRAGVAGRLARAVRLLRRVLLQPRLRLLGPAGPLRRPADPGDGAAVRARPASPCPASRPAGSTSPTVRQALHRQAPAAFPNTGWYPGRNLELAFGQGGTIVTPLQLARAYATFANGGTRYRPRLALDAAAQGGGSVTRYAPTVAAHVPLPASARDPILQGLVGAVRQPGGTATATFQGFPFGALSVAGKTGTASAVDREPAAWFACFAPTRGARYAMAVSIDQAGYGASAAAPVAKQALQYLATHPVSGVRSPG